MAYPSQVAQLPTQISPQALATLFPGQPAQAATPPGAGPAALFPQPTSAPTSPTDQSFVEQSKALLPLLTESKAAQEARAARGEATGLTEEAAKQPIPSYSWTQSEHPAIRILATLANMTRLGQAADVAAHRGGVEKYQQQQSSYAERVKAAQARAAGAEEEEKTIAQPLSRTIWGAGQVTGKEITTQQKAIADRQHHDEQLSKIEQNATALGLKADALAALKQYHQAYLQSFDKRTAANEDVAMAEVGARRDASAASNITKYATEHPILTLLGIGGEVAPAGAGTETPGAAAAKGAGRAAAPAKPGAAKPGAEQYRRDPQTKKVQRSTDGGKTWH